MSKTEWQQDTEWYKHCKSGKCKRVKINEVIKVTRKASDEEAARQNDKTINTWIKWMQLDYTSDVFLQGLNVFIWGLFKAAM